MTKHSDDPLVTAPLDGDPFATDEREPEDGAEHLPSEITYDEQRYPARPTRLRPVARRRLRDRLREAVQGDASAANDKYVKWLVEESMLWDAKQLAIQLSGQGSMFQNPFAHPDPRAALERASVWFTAYPLSFITRPGQSFLAGLADPALWQAFTRIGIDAVHTGPVKQAGASTAGARRRRSTATSTASACRSTRRSVPRSSSARSARRRPSTTAP